MAAGFESAGRDAMSGFCCFRSVLRRLAFVDALVADFQANEKFHLFPTRYCDSDLTPKNWT